MSAAPQGAGVPDVDYPLPMKLAILVILFLAGLFGYHGNILHLN